MAPSQMCVRCILVQGCLLWQQAHGASKVFTPFQFNGKGDARTNDTIAVQRALDAAADAGAGTLWLPSNGTFMLGAGLQAIGRRYNGVTIQVDGTLQVLPPPAVWAPCTKPLNSMPYAPCFGGAIVTVFNVDGLTMTSKTNGTIQGFLFDEHAKPVAPGGPTFMNSTNLVIENFAVKHLEGSGWIHNCQNVMWRNMYAYNRGTPEETGNLEIGGIGSHGAKFPGSPLAWQYLVPLMRANNVTVRDSYFNGGDDNICIKNDTSNVLVENCSVGDGHGATLGSIPDCNGCYGYAENITFRNITMLGNAPLKFKTWANTTGMIRNILFENIMLANSQTLLEISAWYGNCKWCHEYVKPTTKCEYIKGFGMWGGTCAQTENNIALQNITLRHVRGKVESAGSIICREPAPCTINLEDIQIESKHGWDCANAKIETGGTNVTPAVPTCRTGPHFEDTAFVV